MFSVTGISARLREKKIRHRKTPRRDALEACKSVLMSSLSHIQRVLQKKLFAKLNLPKREGNNSPSSSTKIKNVAIYNPNTPSHVLALAGVTTNFVFENPGINILTINMIAECLRTDCNRLGDMKKHKQGFVFRVP
jgi:hypothetical protein